MENLPAQGFGATYCACVSFAWEIVRDSPMENFSQTMNKQIKSMLPGNAKCSMTSLADTKFYSEKDLFVKPRISQLAKTTRG